MNRKQTPNAFTRETTSPNMPLKVNEVMMQKESTPKHIDMYKYITPTSFAANTSESVSSTAFFLQTHPEKQVFI